MNEYKHALEKLGYKLQDSGNHWRARAIYRNGKTNTSLIIYKDSGVWRDFGTGSEPLPFEVLVRETLNTNDPKILSEYISEEARSAAPKKEPEEKIEMEKIYPHSYLEKLLPMKKFYEKKGISNQVQDDFKCGYAGGGKMYRRIVFPIYNLDGEIHGFSGRAVVDNDKTPKWKHLGRKRDWIYPHSLSQPFIEKEKEVILVESIGDCLALYEKGFCNVLVTFGLDASSKLISYLNQFQLDRIIIATNNDSQKDVNSGGEAAIKTFAKLSKVFDIGVICINPPTSNDFGDMLTEDNDFLKWHQRKNKWTGDGETFQKWIVKKIQTSENLKKNKACKDLIKNINGR